MASVEDVLADARDLGFLGPGPISDHVAHATSFLAQFDRAPHTVVDLGAGGGVPGLVLASLVPARWLLVEAMAKRAVFLREAIERLDLANVEVVHGRAEVVVRRYGACASVVVARGFGPPPATAEAAAPFLQVGGLLVVSEPPGGAAERWSTSGLSSLGMALEVVDAGPPAFARIRQVAAPTGFPRPEGRLTKRPLW